MQAARHETGTLLVTKLNIQNAAPYETVMRLSIGPVAAGETVLVYGEAHGEPRQNNQVECAWVSGISVYDGVGGSAIAHPCFYRGADLEKNRKNHESRIGSFTTAQAYNDVVIEYRMRAVNKTAGGHFLVMSGKLGAIL